MKFGNFKSELSFGGSDTSQGSRYNIPDFLGAANQPNKFCAMVIEN